MKRFLAIQFVICLLLFTGCTTKSVKEVESPDFSLKPELSLIDPSQTVELGTTLGYAPEELPNPEWLEALWGWDTFGDTIWLGGTSPGGNFVIASYNTVYNQWQRFDLDTVNAQKLTPKSFSVSEDSIWVLFEEKSSAAGTVGYVRPSSIGYYMFFLNLIDNNSNCIRVPFSGDASSESSDQTICSVQALDTKRAIVTTNEKSYLIDSEANILEDLSLPISDMLVHMRVNNTLFLYLWDNGSFANFDTAKLEFGETLPATKATSYSSNANHYFYVDNRTLYQYEPYSPGEAVEIFRWLDVALSYESLGGGTLFENSKGEFFYPTGKSIVKITKTMLPDKHTLVLACLGDTRDDMANYRSTTYFCSDELLDAIIRFNNTDPEFKIEIKPIFYDDDADRERKLIELATSDDVDVLDTSLLPENAIKQGLLADMLPYLDADENISRDDFVQPLLNAMIKNGGLYEYSSKFSLMTIFTHPSLYSNQENWTTHSIAELADKHHEFTNVSREQVLTSFLLASTAEFIDWENMTCSFDSVPFQNWLRYLGSLPENSQSNEGPLLYDVSMDFAADAGFWAKRILNDNYVVTGFPEASETGSYFVKLDNPLSLERTSFGSSTRLGIMAASTNLGGAWRFVRTLMLGTEQNRIDLGIPSLKANFEKAVDTAVANSAGDPESFNAEDAQMIREQVYNSTGLVHSDEALMNIIQSETKAFFAGQMDVEEVAKLIQSRVSLYLAEQN